MPRTSGRIITIVCAGNGTFNRLSAIRRIRRSPGRDPQSESPISSAAFGLRRPASSSGCGSWDGHRDLLFAFGKCFLDVPAKLRFPRIGPPRRYGRNPLPIPRKLDPGRGTRCRLQRQSNLEGSHRKAPAYCVRPAQCVYVSSARCHTFSLPKHKCPR